MYYVEKINIKIKYFYFFRLHFSDFYKLEKELKYGYMKILISELKDMLK